MIRRGHASHGLLRRMTFYSKHLLGFAPLFATMLMVSSPSAMAQERPAAVPDIPSRFEEIGTDREVSLFVKQGRLLKLPVAAAKVMVANPKIASFQVPSPDSVFVFAESAGTTSLYALDARNRVIAAVRLSAGYDLESLSRQVEEEIPGADIEIVRAAGNGLIVRGSVKTPIEARQAIATITAAVGASDDPESGQSGGGGDGGGKGGESGNTPPRVLNQLNVELSAQVNIRVRVVEVSRSLTYELGLNWDYVMNDGKFRMASGTSSSLFNASDAAGAVGDVAAGTPAGTLLRKANSTIGFTNGNLTGVLNALTKEGLATLLAEPNLTALSGETAGFAAGGEVPIVIITNNNISIEYKSYGVILRMTPTLLSPNRISLRIAPEVSDLSDEGSVTLTSGSVIPAFKVRRAETTIELASGESFALAGMLRSNQAQSVDGVPGLHRVPLLGRLFEDEMSDQEDTELVILATAYVVDPVTEGELQTPGKGLPVLDAQLPARASAGYLY